MGNSKETRKWRVEYLEMLETTKSRGGLYRFNNEYCIKYSRYVKYRGEEGMSGAAARTGSYKGK